MLSADAVSSDLIEFSTAAASSAISGYTPAEIRAAYGFNNVSFGSTAANGAGQTIAIVDAYNDPNIASDLATFDAQFGIAAPPSLKVVNEGGGTNLPGTDSSGGWEVETALDVEWAHAIAPGANIVLVEASNDSDSNLFAAVNYARELSAVSVISMSWGSDDIAADASNDKSLAAQYLVTPSGHQGITFVAAAGDTGVATFPSTSPNVLAIGGTDLHLTSSGAITSETAWTPTTDDGVTYSGGGGVSQEFPGRKVPDVSYDAGVGYAEYDSFTGGGGWISVGGTSAGSPQWAGLVAIADQGRALNGQSTLNSATQTITALYAAPSSDFNDITTGSTQFQTATVGYDLATGLGSPKANLLIPYLTSYGGGSSTTTTTTTVPLTPASLSATATSSSSVTVSWSASTGATGYDLYELENGTSVLLGSYSASTTSTSVSGLSASTSFTFQVAAFNSAGSSATKSTQVTTPAAAATLAAPGNFQVSATSSTTANLSWQAVSGATSYQVYQWNGNSGVLIGNLAAGTTSVSVSGLVAGSTDYFYVAASNASSTASTGWVSVVMPAAATLKAPVLTATATSSTSGQLTWTATPGATSYQIDYWNGQQAVSLGNVSASTRSATISGMSPGTTYRFMIVAQSSTSQVASQWATMTTASSAANRAADVTSVGTASSSSGLLPVSVTFNLAAMPGGSAGAGMSVSNPGLMAAANSFAAGNTTPVGGVSVTSIGGISNQATAGASAQTTGYGSTVTIDGTSSSVGEIANLDVGAAVGVAFAEDGYSLGQSRSDFASALAANAAAPADHETNLMRRTLIDSLDTLFGRDVEWADMQTSTVSGLSAADTKVESNHAARAAAAAGSESERPTAEMLAIGLALSALWSEGRKYANESAEPRQSFLKRRQLGL